MMRRAKRPLRQEGLIGAESANGAVDASGFQALGRRQRRQDRRHAPGQHRLASSGRADHQHIMAARRGDNDGPLREFLAAHVAEVNVIVVEMPRNLVHAGGHRLGGKVAGEDADRFRQAVDAKDTHLFDDRSFASIGAGYEQARQAAFGRGHRHRQRSLDGTDTAVERQFADHCAVAQLFGQQLAGGDEHAERDGQIEAAGVLAQVGRCEVDHRTPGGACVAEIGKGTLDAMDAFPDGHLGKPNQDGLGHPAGRIDFDLDGDAVDADEGEGVELGEHATILRSAKSRRYCFPREER